MCPSKQVSVCMVRMCHSIQNLYFWASCAGWRCSQLNCDGNVCSTLRCEYIHMKLPLLAQVIPHSSLTATGNYTHAKKLQTAWEMFPRQTCVVCQFVFKSQSSKFWRSDSKSLESQWGRGGLLSFISAWIPTHFSLFGCEVGTFLFQHFLFRDLALLFSVCCVVVCWVSFCHSVLLNKWEIISERWKRQASSILI